MKITFNKQDDIIFADYLREADVSANLDTVKQLKEAVRQSLIENAFHEETKYLASEMAGEAQS